MSEDQLERVETLARIGSSLAGVQFEAAAQQPTDLTQDKWAFGYCFGLLEAMAQYANLDQYTDGVKMMSNALGKMMCDEMRGLEFFGQAVDLQSEPDFIAGQAAGAQDLTAWAEDANALPTQLARHLERGARH